MKVKVKSRKINVHTKICIWYICLKVFFFIYRNHVIKRLERIENNKSCFGNFLTLNLCYSLKNNWGHTNLYTDTGHKSWRRTTNPWGQFWPEISWFWPEISWIAEHVQSISFCEEYTTKPKSRIAYARIHPGWTRSNW